MKTPYNDPNYNAAFDRCIDIMAKLMLKYGPDIIQELDKPQSSNNKVENMNKSGIEKRYNKAV